MTELHISEIIKGLEMAYEETTRGVWQKGQTTHHTVNQADYHIAEFRHSRDANFCDQAHNNFPKVLEYIRKLEQSHRDYAGKVKLDQLLSVREDFEVDYKFMYPGCSLEKNELGRYVDNEIELAWHAYNRVYRQLKLHAIKKNLHSHYVIGKKTDTGIAFSTRPKVHKTIDRAMKDKTELEDRFQCQFNIYGKIYTHPQTVDQPRVEVPTDSTPESE